MTCPPDHKHAASTTCYHVHGCRCDACVSNLRKRERDRRRAKAYGRFEGQLDPTGTIRRIQGLQVLGWSLREIAEVAGINNHTALQGVLNSAWVRPVTRDKVSHAFDVLVRRGAGTSVIAANRAKAKGWVSPYAWDSIDDDLEPATVESYRPTVDDLVAEIDGFVEAGESAEQVAKAVNRNIHYLERAMWKHGRQDLATFFYHARKRSEHRERGAA